MTEETVHHVVVKCLTTVIPKNVAKIWLVHEVAVHLIALAGVVTIKEATDTVMVQDENNVLLDLLQQYYVSMMHLAM